VVTRAIEIISSRSNYDNYKQIKTELAPIINNSADMSQMSAEDSNANRLELNEVSMFEREKDGGATDVQA
jgi:hypothetical protein